MQTTDSSESLNQRVQLALCSNPYLTGRSLRFENSAGHVVLRGTVGSYFQKQMAQEYLRRVEGVRRIENFLEVR